MASCFLDVWMTEPVWHAGLAPDRLCRPQEGWGRWFYRQRYGRTQALTPPVLPELGKRPAGVVVGLRFIGDPSELPDCSWPPEQRAWHGKA